MPSSRWHKGLNYRVQRSGWTQTQKWAADPCGPTFLGGALLRAPPPPFFFGPGGIAHGRTQVHVKLFLCLFVTTYITWCACVFMNQNNQQDASN